VSKEKRHMEREQQNECHLRQLGQDEQTKDSVKGEKVKNIITNMVSLWQTC